MLNRHFLFPSKTTVQQPTKEFSQHFYFLFSIYFTL
jgi:hypothetical protein